MYKCTGRKEDPIQDKDEEEMQQGLFFTGFGYDLFLNSSLIIKHSLVMVKLKQTSSASAQLVFVSIFPIPMGVPTSTGLSPEEK